MSGRIRQLGMVPVFQFLIGLGCVLMGSATLLSGQIPFIENSESSGQEILSDGQLRKWTMESATSALQSGLVGVALARLEDYFSERIPEDADVPLLQLKAWLHLMDGDLEAVELIRAGLRKPLPFLLLAYLSYFEDDLAGAGRLLLQIDPDGLPSWQRGWPELLEALILSAQGSVDSANAAFEEAARRASSASVRRHFELHRQMEEIRRGRMSAVDIGGLRETMRSMQGQRAGFEAARLIAIALASDGQIGEALGLLNEQLTEPGLDIAGLRPAVLLTMGLIGGVERTRSRMALTELVGLSQGVREERLGLSILAGAAGDAISSTDFLELLDQWLDQPHALTERILYYRARIQGELGRTGLASADARELIRRFPRSEFLGPAYLLLAALSWEADPPQYRAAADYLGRSRATVDDPARQHILGSLIADAYFANGDYLSASEAYAAVFRTAGEQDAGRLLFLRNQSLLYAREVERAAEILEAAWSDFRVGADFLWMAEWNFARYLMENSGQSAALERIEILTSRESNPSSLIQLRMEWLRWRLQLDLGNPQLALEGSLQLVEKVGRIRQSAVPSLTDSLDALMANSLLLQGEAAFRLDQAAVAVAAFSELREAFPESGAATLSFLVEGRTASGQGGLVNAQQSLIELVDRFPESETAPIALWEAALNAEQRGLPQHLQEAIGLLERIVTEYPDHPLVFYCRLKQGDLARRLNDFGTALIIYERILLNFPEHPERWRAELSEADALAALSSEDPRRLEDVELIYERIALSQRRPLPVRLEAGYKWSQILRNAGRVDAANDRLWMLYSLVTASGNPAEAVLLSGRGRYWFGRLAIEVARLFEEQGLPDQAIRIYQSLEANELPGTQIARQRLQEME